MHPIRQIEPPRTICPNLEKCLGGERFATNDKAESAFTGYFEKLDDSDCKQGIKAIALR